MKFADLFTTSQLQFGFKPGYSTTLCTTGIIKNAVSRYIHNETSVLGCFLDASKAFDMVDHGLLFQKLLDRGLPLLVVRFLLSWHSLQEMKVRWNSSTSQPFGVSNGVRQGSLPSSICFVY